MILAIPPRVRAQADPAAVERGARAKVAEAEHLFASGRYQEAEARLREAYQLFPSPNLHYTFGRLAELLGRPADALERFDRFLRESRPDDPDIAEQRADAAQRVPALEREVVTVDLLCNVEGAEVLVDGEPRGHTPLAAPLRLPPGLHQIVVRAAGSRPPFVDRIQGRAGDRVRLQTYLAPPLPVPAPAGAHTAGGAIAAVSSAPEPARPSSRRRWLWVAAGVAVAVGGGVALVYGTRDRVMPPLCSDCNWGVHPIGDAR